MTRVILFKGKSLRWFYLIIVPFSIVVISLFVLLMQWDKISAWVLFPYMAWLVYDIYYFKELCKLNPKT